MSEIERNTRKPQGGLQLPLGDTVRHDTHAEELPFVLPSAQVTEVLNDLGSALELRLPVAGAGTEESQFVCHLEPGAEEEGPDAGPGRPQSLRQRCLKFISDMEESANALPGFLGRVIGGCCGALRSIVENLMPEGEDEDLGEGAQVRIGAVLPEAPPLDPFRVEPMHSIQRFRNWFLKESPDVENRSFIDSFYRERRRDPVQQRIEEQVQTKLNVSASRLDAEEISQLRHYLRTNNVQSPVTVALERLLAERDRVERQLS